MGMATVSGTTFTRRIETRRLPRSTGALSGLLVILLGIWGGLIPFVGPYFHYAFGSYRTWHYTSARLWLCIVPGAVAVIGGLMLLRSSRRSSGLLGGWLVSRRARGSRSGHRSASSGITPETRLARR
jgi:hypothetical protein